MKINTTKKLAQIGRYHTTYHAIWDKIPTHIKHTCTSKQLALIIDFAYSQKVFGENLNR